MTDEQITEAAGAVQVSSGVSTYLYGTDYDMETYLNELRQIADYIKSKSPA